jgi:hypothetical protein
LPVGIIFVPLIEVTVRRFGIVQTLHFTNALGIVFGSLLLVPSLYVQAFNFLIFTCFRAYLYATLNTFIALTFVSFNSIHWYVYYKPTGYCIHHLTHTCFWNTHRACQPWVA